MKPAKRARARRGEGERLRQEIVDAAEGLLIETADAEAVSMRAIAEAVGCTAPSIYLHFADKKELLSAVVEQQFDKLDRYVQGATEESEDPVEVLRLQGRAYLRFGLENPEHYRLLFMGADLGALDPEALLKLSCFGRVVESVERCIAAGRFRRDDPFAVACGLWVTLHGLTSLLIAKPHFPWPDGDLFDRFFAMCLDGLALPASK